MKRKLLISLLSFICFGFVFYFTSCQKTETSTKSDRVVTGDFNQIQINNHFTISTQKIEKWDDKFVTRPIRYTGLDAKTDYVLFMNLLSGKSMKDICKSLTGINIEPQTIVFYLSKTGDNQKVYDYDENNVSAISLYVPVNGIYYHKLFVKNNNEYIEKKDYFIQANYLSSGSMLFLLRYILPKETIVTSFICLRNGDMKVKRISSQDDFLLKKALYFTKFVKENKSLHRMPDRSNSFQGNVPGGGGDNPVSGCGVEPACQSGNATDNCTCIYYDDPEGHCEGLCFTDGLDNACVSNEWLDSTELAEDFNFDLSYTFRDAFLMPSYLGYKYVMDYYAISPIALDHLTSGFGIEVAEALPQMYICITKLMSPSGHENDILVDSSYHNQLTAILNELSGFSADTSYQTIIADLQNDLDWYEGKKVSEILALF